MFYHFKNVWGYLVVILCAYILLTLFSEELIFTNDFFLDNTSTQFSIYSKDEFLKTREKFWWVPYLMQIVPVLLKILFAALCIFIGFVLNNIDFTFKDLLGPVIIAEIFFVIAQLIFLFNLYFHRTELTFETTANYFPLSMLSFWGTENVVSWLHYPLQTLNLFEVFYILFISWLLSRQWKPNFVESLNIVLPSYGTGLLLWLVLVTFLTLQIS